MTTQHKLLPGNDNLVRLSGFQNYTTGAYINNATVTATLYDPDEVAVPGATGLTLTYVAASDGEYSVTFPYTITYTSNTNYRVEITADGGAGLRGFWNVPIAIERRDQT